MTDAEVMACFESLGDNCEFGIAQRMAGIDPFGLFRFSQTPFPLLMNMLDERFEGLGTSVSIEAPKGEWLTTDQAFGWTMHTWLRPVDIDYDRMLQRETKRVRFLKDRMLDLLTESSRIFVVKSVSLQEAEALHEALLSFGPNSLLTVTEGDAPLGIIQTGLAAGTVPNFAPIGAVDKKTDGPSWHALCRHALSVFRTVDAVAA